MRIGLSFPNGGPMFGSTAISKIAKTAEKLDFHSLWGHERLLYPTRPRNPYGGSHIPWPEFFRFTADPLESLSYVAALTDRIKLGISVLNIPYYNPVVLARRLTTLDVLSHGRLHIGFGLGWSEDEMEAAGSSMRERGRRADEFLALLKAIWTDNPVSFQGEFYSLPESIFDLKPVQKPHPPIYMGTYNSRGLKRAATLADGWNPAGSSLQEIQAMGDEMRAYAAEAGRDPAELGIVMRVSILVHEDSQGEDRPFLTGSIAQIQGDLAQLEEAGVDEIIVTVGTLGTADGIGLDEFLARLQALSALL